MKAIKRQALQLLGFMLIVFSVLLDITTSASAVEYVYTDIFPPGLGYVYAYASGINDSGAVVGYTGDGKGLPNGIERGFIYSGGKYTELLPPGWKWAATTGINDSGAVVGYGGDDSSSPSYKGFIYSGGVYTELLPPWFIMVAAAPYDINNSGAVVGWGNDGTSNKGYLYSEVVYTELNQPGFCRFFPAAINDSGAVVGWGVYGSDIDHGIDKGFLYSGGVYTEILPPGWVSAEARDINNSGAVVGKGYDGTTHKGFLYSKGVYTEIHPPGWINSDARAINDSGAVVGDGTNSNHYGRGFLYKDGVYTELFPPGWDLGFSGAYSINAGGAVVGYGADGSDGIFKGFLAMPDVVTIPTYDGSQPVTFTSPTGSGLNVQPIAPPAACQNPNQYPLGFFDITVSGITAGSAVTVTMDLPPGQTIKKYIKYDGTSCYDFTCKPNGSPPCAEIDNVNHKVYLHFIDGQTGDSDGLANGIILDPGAPAVEPDSDGDGVLDSEDQCPASDLSATIVVGSCNTGVQNKLFPDGCTMSDEIAKCAAGAKNHGAFVSCVAHLTNDWKAQGLIKDKEKGAIQSCAAKTK
jgi:probable HAF family extracellular repeat protein